MEILQGYDYLNVPQHVLSEILSNFGNQRNGFPEYSDSGFMFRYLSDHEVLIYRGTDMVRVLKSTIEKFAQVRQYKITDATDEIYLASWQVALIGQERFNSVRMSDVYYVLDGKDNLLLYNNSQSVIVSISEFHRQIQSQAT